MVSKPHEDHGIISHLQSIFRSPSSVDEEIKQLHDSITVFSDCVEERCDLLKNKLDATKQRLQRRVDRRDDCDSIHELEPSFKEWLELENVFHNWALLYEGLPDWDEAYEAGEIEVIEDETELFETSEQLATYKETLEEIEDLLRSVYRKLGNVRKALNEGLNWKVSIESVRNDLNEQINKLVDLEQAAQTIEKDTLEASRRLAEKIINNHSILESPSFGKDGRSTENFRYYVLDQDDDFHLLSYWIFHDEIDGYTLKPRNKTRYKAHTDSSCPVRHVNLYVEDPPITYLIHVIPYEEQEAWWELVDTN